MKESVNSDTSRAGLHDQRLAEIAHQVGGNTTLFMLSDPFYPNSDLIDTILDFVLDKLKDWGSLQK